VQVPDRVVPAQETGSRILIHLHAEVADMSIQQPVIRIAPAIDEGRLRYDSQGAVDDDEERENAAKSVSPELVTGCC